MDPRRTRLFLDTLDERIVPDATPLAPPPVAGHCHEVVTYDDGHTCGAGVATYYCVSGPEDDATSGGDGNDGDYTTASDTASYDNDQTPADDVITHADGSDGSNPGDQAVTQVGNLNDLQDKTVPDLNLTTNVPVDPAAPGNPHASEITNPTSASDTVSYDNDQTSATDTVSYDNDHTPADDVITYDNDYTTASDTVSYDNGYTAPEYMVSYDNGYTSGSGVSNFDFGSGSGTGNNAYTSYSIPTPLPTPPGPPQWLFPTRQEAIDQNKKSTTKLDELSDAVAGLMLELIINERDQAAAAKDGKDLTLTPAEQAAALLELNALKKKYEENVQSLRDSVSEYKKVERDLKSYNRDLNFSVDVEPYLLLPDGYLKYAPPLDPRKTL